MSYELKAPNHHHSAGEDLFNELFTKEAYVTGAKAPDIVESEHAGIPYATRRKAYLRYVKEKSKEEHTSLGKALLTGAGIGAGMGALINAPYGNMALGAAAGAVGGGLVGAIAKVSDDEEIRAARRAVKGNKSVVNEMLADRMAHRHSMEREQDRAERRANTAMLAGALSRPRVVNNNYNTRVKAISVRNNVRSSTYKY